MYSVRVCAVPELASSHNTLCNYNSMQSAIPVIAAKCARAHFTSKWSRPSHRPPQGRPTLLLRACTIYALGGEWREPAAEDKLCVPVPRQAHTRTRAYVKIVQPNEIPGRRNPEESRLPARANHKTFANGSKHHRSCLAHASKFFLLYENPSPKNISQ